MYKDGYGISFCLECYYSFKEMCNKFSFDFNSQKLSCFKNHLYFKILFRTKLFILYSKQKLHADTISECYIKVGCVYFNCLQ